MNVVNTGPRNREIPQASEGFVYKGMPSDGTDMTDTDNVVVLPILSMAAMDPKVCDADKLFEPAMSYRFPANPGSKLLSEARRQVLAYLNWITSDNGITSEGPDFAVDEIRRACARLIEIAELFPFVFDAEKEAEVRTLCEKDGVGAKGKDGNLSSLPTTPPEGADR